MKHQVRLKSRFYAASAAAPFIVLAGIAGIAPLRADQSPSSSSEDNDNPAPVAEIVISSEFLGRLTRLPINQAQDVVTTVDRTTIATRIASNGVANVTTWATDKPGLSFCVVANNQIHADIDATIRGPARIFVQTDAVAETAAASRKCFRLDDAGLQAWPAATNANTKLKVLDLDVWAGGLFPRLKQRLGQRKAQEEMARRIPENEREVNQRAITTINDLLNSRTKDMVGKVNAMWREWLRDATVRSKLFKHPPRFATAADAMWVYVPGSQATQKLQLRPSKGDAVMARLHRAYLREIAQIYMAGVTISDGEILAAINGPKDDYTTVDEVLGSPEDVVGRFSALWPLDVSMQDDVMTITLSFDEITTQGEVTKGINLVVPVRLRDEAQQGVVVVLPERLTAIDRASGAENHRLTEIFTRRWLSFATQREFAAEELRQKYAPDLPLRLAQMTAREDALTVVAKRGEEREFDEITRKIMARIGLK